MVQPKPEFTGKDLFDYQQAVLENWEKNNRTGLVKHATGSGKTFTSIFALKKHFEENSVGLIIVPSSSCRSTARGNSKNNS